MSHHWWRLYLSDARLKGHKWKSRHKRWITEPPPNKSRHKDLILAWPFILPSTGETHDLLARRLISSLRLSRLESEHNWFSFICWKMCLFPSGVKWNCDINSLTMSLRVSGHYKREPDRIRCHIVWVINVNVFDMVLCPLRTSIEMRVLNEILM